MPDDDVPSPIDFHDPAQARAWVEETIRGCPYRPRFSDAFASTLNERFDKPIDVLELGSGPGHLVEVILQHCAVMSYVALDFSAAMHDLSRARLVPFLDRVEFVERDFRVPDWGASLRNFDAVVTLQAAHEMRHKRHLLSFLVAARERLTSEGSLLYCDHSMEPGTGKIPDLMHERDAQLAALHEAGFTSVNRLLDDGGMAL
jgi:SAM-dependent methyltransferase